MPRAALFAMAVFAAAAAENAPAADTKGLEYIDAMPSTGNIFNDVGVVLRERLGSLSYFTLVSEPFVGVS